MRALIFDQLPQSVMIDGERYPVAWGYRSMMLVELEIFGENPDRIKIRNALTLFYLGNTPPNEAEAIKHMLWFYECGNEAQAKPQGQLKRKLRRAYDFDVDAPLFYAAFYFFCSFLLTAENMNAMAMPATIKINQGR